MDITKYHYNNTAGKLARLLNRRIVSTTNIETGILRKHHSAINIRVHYRGVLHYNVLGSCAADQLSQKIDVLLILPMSVANNFEC